MTPLTSEKAFRPLLAASVDTEEQLAQLRYPLVASPKLDGIRVLIHPTLGPVTRSLKPVRSRLVNGALRHPALRYLDGEITAGPRSAPDVFNRTTSCVMAEDGYDEFSYWVFDDWQFPEISYEDRWMKPIVETLGVQWDEMAYVKILNWETVNSPEDILQCEEKWLTQGFEGIMLRDPLKGYKFNRSTLREQTLLKLKRFKDGEAIITGVEPRLRNQNPQERNVFGLAERSSHKAGQVSDDALGSLTVQDCSGRFGVFSIGSGFDENARRDLWDRRGEIIGQRIAYKFQEVGVLNAPRFPIWKGFRPTE